MNISKEFSLNGVHEILLNIIRDNQLPLNERILLFRFLSKLEDSASFTQKVHNEFGAIKFKLRSSDITIKIQSRTGFPLECGFYLRPVGRTNWELTFNDDPFLLSLDKETARKIALDINIAYAIKSSQLARKLN